MNTYASEPTVLEFDGLLRDIQRVKESLKLSHGIGSVRIIESDLLTETELRDDFTRWERWRLWCERAVDRAEFNWPSFWPRVVRTVAKPLPYAVMGEGIMYVHPAMLDQMKRSGMVEIAGAGRFA